MYAGIIGLTVFILALDILWLYFSRTGYQRLVYAVQKKNLRIKIVPAVLSYMCVLLGLWCFSIPAIQRLIKKTSTRRDIFMYCLMYGGGLGFIIYGVFNFTNMAIFTDYHLEMAIRDTMWGTVLYTMACCFYFWVLG